MILTIHFIREEEKSKGIDPLQELAHLMAEVKIAFLHQDLALKECRASLPSRTRCSPLKLGLASLSFFHLGKTLQTLDFKVRLLLRSLMSQGKHNSLSLARPLLFFQGRLSSAKTESVTLGKEKKGEGSRWNPARQALAFGRLAYCSR
ncbi:hypothetical protein V6N12_034584 [Hibiscus sabdariffa]|uniref:Uncharacterized protein n=1 Tax=Hibiscus sabdariffa TaxID=183260 RepID=A0ABR2DHL3_9ROSI